MIYLVIYFVLFLLTLYGYWKKKHSIDSGFVLIALYALYGLSSIFLYRDSDDFKSFEISVFPLLFLYLCLMLSFSPVLSFNSGNFKGILPPTGKGIEIIVWMIIFSYVFQINIIVNDLSDGIMKILLDERGGADLYAEASDNASKGGIGISNIFAIFGNLFYNFGVLLFFYYLTLKKKKKTIIICLLLTMLLGILSIISKGHRGGVVNHLLVIAGTYFMIKDYIDTKTKKAVKIAGIVILIVVAIPFVALTTSRFSMREGGVEASTFNYTGQSVLLFDKYAFDNNGIRYGDRCAPMFKQLLGFDNVPRNFEERRIKYPHLYINDEVFVTFVGDLCFDFGPIIAFLLIVIFSRLTKKIILYKGVLIPFYKLIPLHFAMTVCIEGGPLASFADTGNLVIVIYFLMYVYFLINYNLNRVPYRKAEQVAA